MHGIATSTLSVTSTEVYEWVKSFRPNVLFSLYFRDIVPETILDIPDLGAVNLHPSLLPKYRGTFSSVHAILNGEKFTGFTYHYMLPEVDAGNIIMQCKVAIEPHDTAYSLYHRLIVEGMTAFDEAFRLVTEERSPGERQVGEPSYYRREVPFGGYIDPRWSGEQIDRFIRAMYFPPFTGARIRLVGGHEKEVSSLVEYDAILRSGQMVVEGGR
jgi:methionyl-tRNA formyltransferase